VDIVLFEERVTWSIAHVYFFKTRFQLTFAMSHMSASVSHAFIKVV